MTTTSADISTINWNRDMSTAPRGERVVVGNAPARGGGTRTITEFKAEYILVCIIDKGVRKVFQTYRSEPNAHSPTGRWVGLHTEQEVYAWAKWPEPIDA